MTKYGPRPETCNLETDKERLDFFSKDLEVNKVPFGHIAVKTIWNGSKPIELKGDPRSVLMTLEKLYGV